MTYKEKKAKATELELEFKGNIGEAELDVLIESAEAEAKEDAEMLAQAAKDMKPQGDGTAAKKVITEKQVKASGIRESTRMLKVSITALATEMREIPSEMYTVMTKFGTKKQVVKFGKEMLVYKVIVDSLRERETLLQIKSTNKAGVEVVTLKMSKAFVIEDLPLTEEELAEIKGQ